MKECASLGVPGQQPPLPSSNAVPGRGWLPASKDSALVLARIVSTAAQRKLPRLSSGPRDGTSQGNTVLAATPASKGLGKTGVPLE